MKELCGFFVSTLLYLTGEQDDKDEERLEEARRTVSESRSMEELLDFLDQIFRPFASRPAQAGKLFEPIREAVAYMKAHYAEKITLSMVAGKVSFNPEYFSRMFMKETGLNFVTYLNNLRMRQAVELLEWTNKKIYEIAEEVGYSSVSYFSTAFKKTFGQTPNEYQIHIRRHKHDDSPRQRRDPDRRWYSYRTPYLLFWLQKKDKGAINHERIQYRQRIHGICGRRIYPFRQRSGLSGMDGIKEVPYGASFFIIENLHLTF